MPTLVDHEVVNRTRTVGGETAQASDIAWMQAQFAPDDDHGQNKSNDSSTLSGSMLLAALEDMKQIEFGDGKGREEQEEENLEEQKSFCLLTSRSFESFLVQVVSQGRSPAFSGDHPPSDATKPSLVERLDRPSRKQRREDRKMGPNEHRYTVEYQDFVETRIRGCRNRNPDLLPDYRYMDTTSREKEQERVVRLLHRIGIAGSGSSIAVDKNQSPQELRENDRLLTNERAVAACDIHPQKPQTMPLQDSVCIPSEDKSLENPMPLFSPSEGAEGSVEARSCEPSTDSGAQSTQSIEFGRGDMSYESPDPLKQPRMKRYASTSGKRGSGSTRPRMLDNSVESCSEEAAYSIALETSMRELALADDKVFAASQSPIARRLSSPSCPIYSPRDRHISVSFGDTSSSENFSPRSNDSIDETTFPDRRDFGRSDDQSQPDFPSYPCIKAGNVVHFEPLAVKFNRKPICSSSARNCPDPIRTYPDYLRRRLGRIYNWLHKRDCWQGKGIVLSLSQGQTVDTTLKVLLDEHPSENSTQSRVNLTDLHAIGSTLIVVRTKDDLDVWCQALREKTSFSVLNHASVPLKERKTQWATEKRTRYDVVLTTFDALKMPDVNIVLDSQGFALISNEKENGGWYGSRSESQPSEVRQCKQLTVLHRIRWKRLICVDVIGRKSYLVKAGTARVLATRAINADTRFLFFSGPYAEDSATTALIKSDKSALRSIAAVLGMPTETAEDALLRDMLIDFQRGHDATVQPE